MPVLTVHHTTTYRYQFPVAFGEHSIIARPQAWRDQQLLSSSLAISPKPARLNWSRDQFGNWIGVAAFRESAAELRFHSIVQVEHRDHKGPDWAASSRGSEAPDYSRREEADLAAWFGSPQSDEAHPVTRWARDLSGAHQGESWLGLLKSIMAAIRRFRYVRRSEQGTQPGALTLAQKSGSCRDLATLMIEAAQELGFAARFVSGYIRVPVDDRQGLLGGGSTHAWVQVYLPGVGWLDFDPTNNLVGNRDLVRIAVAQRAYQVLPLSGTWFGKASDSVGMTVAVNVTSGERPTAGPSTSIIHPEAADAALERIVSKERG